MTKNQKKKKPYTRDDSVIILTDANFKSTIKRFKHLLVEYTSTWCGKYCQDFSFDFTRASIKLSKLKPRVHFARMYVDQNEETKKIIEMKRYPTLYYYEKGIQNPYTGTNSHNGILKWALKKSAPPLQEMLLISEITNFKNTHEIALIYFGNDTTVKEFLYEQAKQDRDMFYCYAAFSTALGHFSVKNNTLVVFKKFGEERTEMSGTLTPPGMKKFIEKYSINKVLEFSEEVAKRVFEEKTPALFVLRDPSAKNAELYDRICRNIAEALYGRILLVLTGIPKNDEYTMKEGIFTRQNDLPTVRIVQQLDRKRDIFSMNDKITEENIIKFVGDWEKGLLKAMIKSDEIPTVQTDEVFKVVGKTFTSEVLNYPSNVLVLYYSSHHSNSKEYRPEYEAFANIINKHNNELNLRVATIDMAENEIENFSTKSYPQLDLYRLNSNNEDNKKDVTTLTMSQKNLNEFISIIETNLNVSINNPKDDL